MTVNQSHSDTVRKPVFAGKFYPSAGNHLSEQLKELFANAKAPVTNDLPQAIIAPHAGYMFSGGVAASAYNQLPENAEYKRVFVLATSHHCLFKGASVCDAEYYETPLGKIKVDSQVKKSLFKMHGLMQYRPDAHNHEHSLEVQLPFLQHRLGNNFLLVPVVIGTYDVSECEKIARALEQWFTPENLFVVSTDFSHYPAYDDAVENDLDTAQAICSNNPETLSKFLASKKNIENLATSLCGSSSVLTLLNLTHNRNFKYIKIQYRNSGDAPGYGEKERVVGYWAIAVYRVSPDLSVPDHLQARMLEKARAAVSEFVATGKQVQAHQPEHRDTTPAGMFVTVYVNGKLRGCMGNITGGDSLDAKLEQLAVSACCDNRFDCLTINELEDMELEISVLSPLRKIHSIDEIELGKHGIYIKKGTESGTFLPKVAVKTGWSVIEFLGHCARDKAGIGWNGWKDADIYVYEAFVFRG